MTNRPLVIRPGPKRLAAALRRAGFSETRILPAVTDACAVHWPAPSELQAILALCGGESSGNATAFHANTDGSVDYGVLQINGRAHASYFGPQTAVAGWLWTDYLDNAEAAFEIYMRAERKFTPWVAYSGGGWLAERYGGKSWMSWSAFGVSEALKAIGAYVAQGKSQADAMALVASIADDPLVYGQ